MKRLGSVLLVVVLALSGAPAFCVSVQPGWPQATGDHVYSSPALADLDGDGYLEVVVGSCDYKVYAWHHDGSPMAGWPQTTGNEVGSPALGDLDGDGDLEVVVGSLDNRVYAWHHDGSPAVGWPQTTGGQVWSSPALADLDGDGGLEVVVASGNDVCAWHHDGGPMAGWPQATGDLVPGSPALGDLDGDGALEVVAGSWDAYIYAWHHDGSSVAGWPRTADSVSSGFSDSPALGDLDRDGDLEVVSGCWNGGVYAWHHDGSPAIGWPQYTGRPVFSSPALGDLDGDGYLEVVAASNEVHAWHCDGSQVEGWPQAAGLPLPGPGSMVVSSPALGDLDGDGRLEVVVGSQDANVYAWHHDGGAVTDWPQTTGGVGTSSPALGDLDGDGDLEAVIGSYDNNIYAWSCDTPTDDTLAWPMFHHDPLHTGLYGYDATRYGASFISSPVIGAVPLQVTFTDRSTDGPSSWSWDFGDGATSTEQHPTHEYSAVGWYTVSLNVVTNLGPDTETKRHCIAVLFPDVLTDNWAWSQVLSCVDAGIVGGYGDGLYHPEHPVSRDQMAVFISRSISAPTGPGSLDQYVPPTIPSFSDVPTDFWCYKHVEYAVEHDIVGGYGDGTYLPGLALDRGQMAVFIARARAGDDASVPDPVGDPSFPDVPADFWSYRHVEYIAGEGIAGGYYDGLYHPEYPVTRDQMAVFICRAFDLSR